jgi:hypothetical protein
LKFVPKADKGDGLLNACMRQQRFRERDSALGVDL